MLEDMIMKGNISFFKLSLFSRFFPFLSHVLRLCTIPISPGDRYTDKTKLMIPYAVLVFDNSPTLYGTSASVRPSLEGFEECSHMISIILKPPLTTGF